MLMTKTMVDVLRDPHYELPQNFANQVADRLEKQKAVIEKMYAESSFPSGISFNTYSEAKKLIEDKQENL